MKILITAPSLDENENVSGISALVRQIVKRSGHEFVHFQAGRRDGEASGLRWFWKQVFLTGDFSDAIKREDPDVVHINTSLVRRAIIRDVLLYGVAHSAGKPVLLHIHGGPFINGKLRLKRLAKNLLKDAQRVIVLSELERQALLKYVPNANIEVLPNAVPVDEIPEIEKNPGWKKILYFGRIDANKGLKEIVEACRILKGEGLEFRFNCYGSGPQKAGFVRDMTAALGDRFFYGGVVTGADKWRVLAENDIFLLPSKYEGLPMALLEAMAAGCVPVVSDVGSVSTVVRDGDNGYLVEPGKVEQVVERLRELLPGDLSGMSENARATIREGFDISRYVERLDAVYDDLLQKKRENLKRN
jgi:glycosyltransferase involved in cell wall biosynthesis